METAKMGSDITHVLESARHGRMLTAQHSFAKSAALASLVVLLREIALACHIEEQDCSNWRLSRDAQAQMPPVECPGNGLADPQPRGTFLVPGKDSLDC